jgi:hypothetical protein
MVTYTTESPNTARKRWQGQYDDNSYHSSIPGNADHAAGVTAYDLSLGHPYPALADDKAYLDYLCAVADWRTDWDKMGHSTKPADKKTLEFRAKEDKGVSAYITASSAYYQTGVLPSDIADENDVVQVHRPGLIVSYTVGDRNSGTPFPKKPT